MQKRSPAIDAKALGSVPAQLAALSSMTVGELTERYRELLGEPTRSRNKAYLQKRLAWRIQELAEGGLSPRSLAQITALGDALPDRWCQRAVPAGPTSTTATTARDTRLPPAGTVLTRLHGGRKHEVTVGTDSFEYAGQTFRSLSAIAREIAGTPWNGFLFFGLDPESGVTRRKLSAPASGVKHAAIYTRKSTTMGLEQEFNSLDAQREACVAYIARHGWQLVDVRYDDGGFTGANTDRPAFQRLMADVAAGYVDVVVVYKVDRLSRSLLDFARVMEQLNETGASFVSVTQNFSTADAMGRMTLGLLMTFAQFEREMTAERTRDKVAAARRKGKWTGGHVPFGYRLVGKRLVIDDPEAAIVREAYDLLLEHRRASLVARTLNERGRWPRGARLAAGKSPRWTKDATAQLLRNPLYAGLISAGDDLCPGEHPALVPKAAFEQAHLILERKEKRAPSNCNPEYLLRGLLHCGRCGAAMSPASTRSHGREYRYYRCSTRNRVGNDACAAPPLPASAIEFYVLDRVRAAVSDGTLAAAERYPAAQAALSTDAQWLARGLQDFSGVWHLLTPLNRARLLRALIERIAVDEPSGAIEIRLVERAAAERDVA